ncbi:MAG TPA: hypothetical protein VF692_06375, partial [Pyrinomonadaceae bacterium]
MTNEIKIVIERRGNLKIVQKRNDFAGHLSPKGIIQRARETDYLPRRLSGGYINIYDLGLTSVENGLVSNPTLMSPPVEQGGSTTLQFGITPAEESEFFTELNASLFAVAAADRKSHFYKILKGDVNYEKIITVAFGSIDEKLENIADEKWTDKGLKLTADEAKSLKIKPNPAIFNSFELDFAAGEIYDAETDEIVADFELKPGADIFLMPTPIFNAASAFYRSGLVDNGTIAEAETVDEVLNSNLQILDRELLTDFLAI